MKSGLFCLAKALAVSIFVGVLCGAAGGAAIGFVAGSLGDSVELTFVAGLFGALAGVYFGAIGALLGGKYGWAFAGLIAGVSIGNYSFGLFNDMELAMYAPSAVFAVIGFAVGSPTQDGPLILKWLHATRRDAQVLKVISVRLLLAIVALGWSANIVWERVVLPTKRFEASRDLSDVDRLDYE